MLKDLNLVRNPKRVYKSRERDIENFIKVYT